MATKKSRGAAALIKAVNKTMGKAVAAGDSAAAAACYTSTAKLMVPNVPVIKGRKAIGAFWQAGFDMGLKGAKLRSVEIDVHGTTAIEVGAYTLTGADRAVIDTGKYIVIWKRDGKAWQLHRDIYNTDNPAH